MDAGQRRHRARRAEQMHVAQIRARARRQRARCTARSRRPSSHRSSRGDIAAAKLLGERDHAERDRHPRFDARLGSASAGSRRSRRIRSSRRRCRTGSRRGLGIEQRRAADRRQMRPPFRGRSPRVRCRSLATRSRKPSAFDAARQASVAIMRSRLAAAPAILSRQIESAEIVRSIAASPTTGRRHALAEPDDARKGVDHAKTVAGRTGDQQPAIVGAEIERRIDRGSRRLRRVGGRQPRAAGCEVSARDKTLAKPRIVIHSNCLSAALQPAWNLFFARTLAAPKACATTP